LKPHTFRSVSILIAICCSITIVVLLLPPWLRPGHRFGDWHVLSLPLARGPMCILKEHGSAPHQLGGRVVCYTFLTDEAQTTSAMSQIRQVARLLAKDLSTECAQAAVIFAVYHCPGDCTVSSLYLEPGSTNGIWRETDEGLGRYTSTKDVGYMALLQCQGAAPNPSLQRTRYARR